MLELNPLLDLYMNLSLMKFPLLNINIYSKMIIQQLCSLNLYCTLYLLISQNSGLPMLKKITIKFIFSLYKDDKLSRNIFT